MCRLPTLFWKSKTKHLVRYIVCYEEHCKNCREKEPASLSLILKRASWNQRSVLFSANIHHNFSWYHRYQKHFLKNKLNWKGYIIFHAISAYHKMLVILNFKFWRKVGTISQFWIKTKFKSRPLYLVYTLINAVPILLFWNHCEKPEIAKGHLAIKLSSWPMAIQHPLEHVHHFYRQLVALLNCSYS